MKTLFLLEHYGQDDAIFFELDGDYRHLKGAQINGDNPLHSDELIDLIYCSGHNYIITPLIEPTRDWDFFIKVGFIP
jgi:hypothetical protein